ncbi:hypothetical protein [Streptosporangium sp. NBC_01469]|uniref:hypothetical protein n=1 Tax=Streptosporangium sp. NBC_01469 TaxID=2903898 RepID=UPI002E2A1C9F|nr:hypothetical protein [Streptosporangium sp. NBC_01469]
MKLFFTLLKGARHGGRLLQQGITAGLSLTELGVPAGGLGKSTMHNRLLRGRARQAGLTSNEKALRAQQRGDRWLTEHGKRLLAAAHQLPAHAERVAAEGDEDFADGLTEGSWRREVRRARAEKVV